MLTVFDVGADRRSLTVLGSLRIIGCAKVARRDVTPPLPRRGERAITPAPTVASPGAAARLGPLTGSGLWALFCTRYGNEDTNTPTDPQLGPIGLIGRNSLTPVYRCEWWGDTNGDAVWTAAWRGQRRPPPIESNGGDRKRNPACTREANMRWQHLERMRLESVAEQGVESGASFAHQSVCVRACPPLIGRCRRQFGG